MTTISHISDLSPIIQSAIRIRQNYGHIQITLKAMTGFELKCLLVELANARKNALALIAKGASL